jgi:hypothetical protein
MPALAAGVPDDASGRSNRGNKEHDIRWGVLFEKVIVTPGAAPERRRQNGRAIETSLAVIRGAAAEPRDVAFETSRATFLDGHPMRLQAAFGRIWQITLQTTSMDDRLANTYLDGVNAAPGEIIRGALGIRGKDVDNVVWQNISSPSTLLSDLVTSNMSGVRESIDRANREPNFRPVVYDDFAVTSLHVRPSGLRMESVPQGVLFLNHRYSPERFLIAVRFPLHYYDEPRCERIAVPFSEPFFCAVDADGNYSFVTDSGRLYTAPKPAAGKLREVEPLFGEPAWRAKVLLRDAKTGGTSVFIQTQAAGPSDRDVLVQLAPKADRRSLPAGFLAGLEGKPTATVLWKCAELLQDKR